MSERETRTKSGEVARVNVRPPVNQASSTRSTSMLLAGLRSLSRKLAAQPDSADIRTLRAWAHDSMDDVEAWTHAQPTPERRQAVLKRLMELYAAVERLGIVDAD
jgi:hypothetical protein